MNDIEKFDEFLSSYNKYYQPVSEISMPCPTHDKNCPSRKQRECVSKNKEPLVSSDFMMYSFDDICRTTDIIDVCNLPSNMMPYIWIKREKFYISLSSKVL